MAALWTKHPAGPAIGRRPCQGRGYYAPRKGKSSEPAAPGRKKAGSMRTRPVKEKLLRGLPAAARGLGKGRLRPG